MFRYVPNAAKHRELLINGSWGSKPAALKSLLLVLITVPEQPLNMGQESAEKRPGRGDTWSGIA